MKAKQIIFLLVFLFAGFSCQTGADLPEKEKPGIVDPGTDPNNPADEDVIVETSGIEINPDAQTILSGEWTQNILVLDSTNFNLQVNESLVQKHNLKPGSILVSDQGDGFLRKIKSIGTASNGKVKIETEFCTLEEVIKEGDFRVTITPKSSAAKSGVMRSSPAFSTMTVNNINIKSQIGVAEITGVYTYGRTVEFAGSIKNFKLQYLYFSLGFYNKLKASAELSLKGKDKVTLATIHFPPFTIPAGVPIVISTTMLINLGAEVTVKPDLLHLDFESGFGAEAVMWYDGQWHSTISRETYSYYEIPEYKIADKVSLKARVFLEPELQFKIYGIIGPFFSIKAFGEFDAVYNRNPGWIASIGAELDGGVKASVFGKELFNFSVPFFEPKPIPVLYARNELSILSGDFQLGASGKQLPRPLVAQVTNTFGYPLSGYKVQFKSTAGGGKLSRTDVTTNANGEASVELTLNSSKNIIDYGHC